MASNQDSTADSGQALAILVHQTRSGANWFYWIAGLSLVNTIIANFDGTFSFIIGLAATQYVDVITKVIIREGGNDTVWGIIGLVLDLLIAGIFVLFGVYASQFRRWAFVLGIILYLLDGVLYLSIQEWVSVAFHVFVLYSLWRGLSAANQLWKLQGRKSAQASV